MSNRNYSSNSAGGAVGGGVGIPTIVFIVFLILKLVGVIDWSWWWVTSPIWITFLFYVAIILIVFIILLVIHTISYIARRKRGRRNGNL